MARLFRLSIGWTAVAGMGVAGLGGSAAAQEGSGLSPQAVSVSAGSLVATSAPDAGGAFQAVTGQLGYISQLLVAGASAVTPVPYGNALARTSVNAGATLRLPALPHSTLPLHWVVSGQYATPWHRGGAVVRLQYGSMDAPSAIGQHRSGAWIGGRLGPARVDSVGFTAWDVLAAPYLAPVGGPSPGGNAGAGGGVWRWQGHLLVEASVVTGRDEVLSGYDVFTLPESRVDSASVVNRNTMQSRVGAHWVNRRLSLNVITGTTQMVSYARLSPTRGWLSASGGVRVLGPATLIAACGTAGTVTNALTPSTHSAYGAIGISLSAWPTVHHRPASVDTDPGTNRLVMGQNMPVAA